MGTRVHRLNKGQVRQGKYLGPANSAMAVLLRKYLGLGDHGDLRGVKYEDKNTRSMVCILLIWKRHAQSIFRRVADHGCSWSLIVEM